MQTGADIAGAEGMATTGGDAADVVEGKGGPAEAVDAEMAAAAAVGGVGAGIGTADDAASLGWLKGAEAICVVTPLTAEVDADLGDVDVGADADDIGAAAGIAGADVSLRVALAFHRRITSGDT